MSFNYVIGMVVELQLRALRVLRGVSLPISAVLISAQLNRAEYSPSLKRMLPQKKAVPLFPPSLLNHARFVRPASLASSDTLRQQKPRPAEDAYSDFAGFDIYRRNSPFQGWDGLCEGRINDTEVGFNTLRNFAALRLHQ